MEVIDRLKRVWNAFRSQDEPPTDYGLGTSYYGTTSPSRPRFRSYNDRSIVTAIYNRISIDAAGIALRHVSLDEFGRYSDDVKSALNACLTIEPNLDQGPRQFRQDIVMTMFDKGVAAIVAVDTTLDSQSGTIEDVYSMRVGEITGWYPHHVKTNVYNEARGARQEITLEKNKVAIVENPLYAVMNEPNSTLQRLIRKLNLLDTVDEQSSSGKLDLIIQLPYVVKSEARRTQAETRRKDIEFQLKGSELGIAYTDATEKITQLNRPVENTLLKHVEYLTQMLYGQLGITEDIMNGTADERAMINYYNRTIEPIADAIIEAMQRTFLGSVGTQKQQRIRSFKDPFKFVAIADIAEIADKFTRNEILTSNEIRGFMGIAPAKDPKADQLVNSNMPQPNTETPVANSSEGSQNGS